MRSLWTRRGLHGNWSGVQAERVRASQEGEAGDDRLPGAQGGTFSHRSEEKHLPTLCNLQVRDTQHGTSLVVQ